MSSEWREVQIGTLIDEGIIISHKDGNHGAKYPRSHEFQETGVPFLTAKLMDDEGNIDINKAPCLDPKKAEEFTFGFVEEDDVLLSHNATVGRVAVMPKYDGEVLIGTSITHFRLDSTKIKPRYFAGYLNSSNFQNQLASVMSQTTRNQVPITTQRNLTVIIPPLDTQASIVDMIQPIDLKLLNNKKLNRSLENVAQAIFKSWFVDFDPVRAKIEAASAGRDPNRAAMAAIAGISSFAKASEDRSSTQDWDEIEAALDQKIARMSDVQQQQLSNTAQLFPDDLEESEIGEVPKGWDYSTIGKEFNIVNGQSPPGSSYNEEREGAPFYQGRTDFGFRFPTQRVYCTEPKRFAKKGDTLLSVRAPVGDLNIAIEDCCIGRGLASLRHKSGSTSYTYYVMKQVQVQIEAYEATGTVFGSINQKQLKALDTILPDDKIINEFHRIAEPIDGQIMNQVFMNRELSELRDTLLPKLISGELEIINP